MGFGIFCTIVFLSYLALTPMALRGREKLIQSILATLKGFIGATSGLLCLLFGIFSLLKVIGALREVLKKFAAKVVPHSDSKMSERKSWRE